MGRNQRRPLADVQNTSHVGTPEADDTSAMKVSSAPKVSALLEELELEGESRAAGAPAGRLLSMGCCAPPPVAWSGQPTHVVHESMRMRDRASRS